MPTGFETKVQLNNVLHASEPNFTFCHAPQETSPSPYRTFSSSLECSPSSHDKVLLSFDGIILLYSAQLCHGIRSRQMSLLTHPLIIFPDLAQCQLGTLPLWSVAPHVFSPENSAWCVVFPCFTRHSLGAHLVSFSPLTLAYSLSQKRKYNA